MAESKPIDGDELDILIADRIRHRNARVQQNADDAKTIARREVEIATAEVELAAMRAARQSGQPYVPATPPAR